jgi:hypothetical protein
VAFVCAYCVAEVGLGGDGACPNPLRQTTRAKTVGLWPRNSPQSQAISKALVPRQDPCETPAAPIWKVLGRVEGKGPCATFAAGTVSLGAPEVSRRVPEETSIYPFRNAVSSMLHLDQSGFQVQGVHCTLLLRRSTRAHARGAASHGIERSHSRAHPENIDAETIYNRFQGKRWTPSDTAFSEYRRHRDTRGKEVGVHSRARETTYRSVLSIFPQWTKAV